MVWRFRFEEGEISPCYSLASRWLALAVSSLSKCDSYRFLLLLGRQLDFANLDVRADDLKVRACSVFERPVSEHGCLHRISSFDKQAVRRDSIERPSRLLRFVFPSSSTGLPDAELRLTFERPELRG
jgi:hypothetical protein